jgi:membrane protease YdiL (CAAX protease family)
LFEKGLRQKVRIVLVFIVLCSQVVQSKYLFAKESQDIESPNSAFSVIYNPTQPRTFLLPPLISFFLPGFDQWWEGQYKYGAIYSGIGAASLTASLIKDSAIYTVNNPFWSDDNRLGSLSALFFQTSGSVSAYHSFRTAVRSRRGKGDFSFLTQEESPLDLLLAPFHFEYFTRATTYLGLPLQLIGAILLSELQDSSIFDSNWSVPTVSDVFYANAFSLNAGVGEEALFRGWLMPVAMHYMDQAFLSNAVTALIFGALHYKPGYIPISQTLGGFYLGFLTQNNNWTIGESIFNHVWFDVIAFLIIYSTANSIQRSKLAFKTTLINIAY